MICQAQQHILSINLLSITTFDWPFLYSLTSEFLFDNKNSPTVLLTKAQYVTRLDRSDRYNYRKVLCRCLQIP